MEYVIFGAEDGSILTRRAPSTTSMGCVIFTYDWRRVRRGQRRQAKPMGILDRGRFRGALLQEDFRNRDQDDREEELKVGIEQAGQRKGEVRRAKGE